MKRSLVVLILWTLVLLGLLLGPIRESQIPIPWGFTHFDKVVHFGLFFVTGFVSVLGTKFLSRFRNRILFGIIFGLFLAAGTELAQSSIPFRSRDFYDLTADVVGLGVALLLYYLLYHRAGLRAFFRL